MFISDVGQIKLMETLPAHLVQLSSDGDYIQGTTIKGKTISYSQLSGLYIEGDLYFEDCEFVGSVDIFKTTASSTLFKNCIFHKQLSLKEVESKISIIGCIFHQSVLFYWDPMVDADIVDIVNSRFFASLTLNGCNKTTVKIHSTKATEIIVGEQSDDTYIELINCEIGSLRIYNSVIKQLSVRNSKIKNDLISNICDSIILKESEIGKIISDDPDFWLFIKEKKLIGPLFQRREDSIKENKQELWLRISESLLVFVHSFQKDFRYSEADTAFYLLRFARVKEKIHTKGLNNKLSGIFSGIFFGLIGGWGVKLLNPILTVAFIIAMYAAIYFYGITSMDPEVTALTALLEALNLSVERYFNLGTNMYNYKYLSFLEVQQGILGIIINTTIVGMFIRKLVR